MIIRILNKIIWFNFKITGRDVFDAQELLHKWKPDIKPVKSKNPTPRKCRGHRRVFKFENDKCNVCGGAK